MLTLDHIIPSVPMIVTPRMTSWRSTSSRPKMKGMILICQILMPYLTPERKVTAEAIRLIFTWLLSRNHKPPRLRRTHDQTISMLLTSPNLVPRLPIPSRSQTLGKAILQTSSRMQDFSSDFPVAPRRETKSDKTARVVECLQRELTPVNKVGMDHNGHPSIMEAP
jgi:hypothetical protein